MKILRKYFSKKEDYKNVKVHLIGGTKNISELTDKQLKNVAAYDNLSEEEKKNVVKNISKFAIPISLEGGALGYLVSKNKKLGAGLGAAVGATALTGLAISGHKLHKKQAKAAKKEIEYRNKLNR
jgi:preprotein translocase subunit Sec63